MACPDLAPASRRLALALALVTSHARAEPPGWPTQVPLEEVVDLSVGDTHACAVTADGLAHCWGDGNDYRLGDGREVSSRSPVRVQGLTGVARVVAGGRMSCALRRDGEVYCWGAEVTRGDDYDPGQPVVTPRLSAPPISGVVALSVGYAQATFVDRLGATSILDHYRGPVPLPAFPPLVTVRSYNDGFCGATREGTLHCVTSAEESVGDGGAGRGFGEDPATILRPFDPIPSGASLTWGQSCSPDEGEGPAPAWCKERARLATVTGKAFDIAERFACFLQASAPRPDRPDRPILGCFGCADCYHSRPPPLGMPPGSPPSVPVVITAAAALPPIEDLAVGGGHLCVLAGGEVWCWGDASEGQLVERPLRWWPSTGPGFDETPLERAVLLPSVASAEPIRVAAFARGEVVRLEAGLATTCALTTKRTVWCWGHPLGTWRPHPTDLLAPDDPPDDDPDRAGAPRRRDLGEVARDGPPAPEGQACREVDVFALGPLEERRRAFDSAGALPEAGCPQGSCAATEPAEQERPTGLAAGLESRLELWRGEPGALALVEEQLIRRDRRGRPVSVERIERTPERTHTSVVRSRFDRAGRLTWRKASGTVDDAATTFRYDRQGRLVAEKSDGAVTTHRHAALSPLEPDPVGLPWPPWSGPPAITEVLTDGWLPRRHLSATVAGTLVYERIVADGDTVAIEHLPPDALGVTIRRERRYAHAFYDTPRTVTETRTIPGEVELVEVWQGEADEPLHLVRRTARLKTGCLQPFAPPRSFSPGTRH